MATTFLRRVEPLSLAKVLSATYLLIGLIVGVIVAALSLVGAGMGAMMSHSNDSWMGALFGVGAVIFLPLLYAIIGFIGGLILALALNVGLRWAGGLQIDLG